MKINLNVENALAQALEGGVRSLGDLQQAANNAAGVPVPMAALERCLSALCGVRGKSLAHPVNTSRVHPALLEQIRHLRARLKNRARDEKRRQGATAAAPEPYLPLERIARALEVETAAVQEGVGQGRVRVWETGPFTLYHLEDCIALTQKGLPSKLLKPLYESARKLREILDPSPATPPQPGPEWLTRKEAAWVMGMTPDQFDGFFDRKEYPIRREVRREGGRHLPALYWAEDVTAARAARIKGLPPKPELAPNPERVPANPAEWDGVWVSLRALSKALEIPYATAQHINRRSGFTCRPFQPKGVRSVEDPDYLIHARDFLRAFMEPAMTLEGAQELRAAAASFALRHPEDDSEWVNAATAARLMRMKKGRFLQIFRTGWYRIRTEDAGPSTRYSREDVTAAANHRRRHSRPPIPPEAGTPRPEDWGAVWAPVFTVGKTFYLEISSIYSAAASGKVRSTSRGTLFVSVEDVARHFTGAYVTPAGAAELRAACVSAEATNV